MPPSRRRRLKGDERAEVILDHAIRTFAEYGFALGTRTLVAELGVSQALLYRYFPSKEALVEAVLDRLAKGRWQVEWDALLDDRRLPLETRLSQFYTAYLTSTDRATMRLFLRASLDGHDVARKLGQNLTGRILAPVVEGLRRAAHRPSLAQEPLHEAERELAMGLHGGLVFLAIRKHVYGYPLPDDLEPLIARQIRIWLLGALAEMVRLGANADANGDRS